jgi:hypothetical protein
MRKVLEVLGDESYCGLTGYDTMYNIEQLEDGC